MLENHEGTYVTKDEFHESMDKIRDRQDKATQRVIDKQTRVEDKIIETMRRMIDQNGAHCDQQVTILRDSLKDTNQDVKTLEAHARKETIVGSLIAGVSASLVAFVTARFGG